MQPLLWFACALLSAAMSAFDKVGYEACIRELGLGFAVAPFVVEEEEGEVQVGSRLRATLKHSSRARQCRRVFW